MEGAVEGPYEAAALRFVEGFARDALVSPETGSETWVRADEIAELKTLLETGRVHVPVPAEMPAPPEIPKPFERTIPPAEFRAAPAPAAPPAVPKTPEPFRDGTADPSVTAIDIPFKTIFAVLLLLAALAGMFWKRTDFAVVARDGSLHWITSEAVARALYGDNWNTKIDDIADTFYTDYTFGADVDSAAAFSPAAETESSATFD
jgi:hypothetical protein